MKYLQICAISAVILGLCSVAFGTNPAPADMATQQTAPAPQATQSQDDLTDDPDYDDGVEGYQGGKN